TIAPSLPVIVLTAITAQNYRARALSRGAFSCLPKPYHRDELRGIVRRAIMATHSSMPSGT
ncbi:MAG: response regulator, partial [Nitrospira sp.]|nr:response regulator [Nitrospira sp.]